MKPEKKIVDTTLRDGEQHPGTVFTLEEKIEIALLLDQLGVHEIEAGIIYTGLDSKEYIQELMEKKTRAKISVWSRLQKDDIEQAIAAKPDIVHIGAPISYVQIYSKLKKNKTWIQARLNECVCQVLDAGIEVTVGFEDASRADLGFMINTGKALKKLGVSTIRIADTVGVLMPYQTKEVIQEMLNHVDIDLEIHTHNDFGMATANSLEALKSGAKYADCTLGGIGERCGNCNLYHLLYAGEHNFSFGFKKTDVKEVEKLVKDILVH